MQQMPLYQLLDSLVRLTTHRRRKGFTSGDTLRVLDAEARLW